MILCWATFLAILSCMQSMGCGLATLEDGQNRGIAEQFLEILWTLLLYQLLPSLYVKNASSHSLQFFLPSHAAGWLYQSD